MSLTDRIQEIIDAGFSRNQIAIAAGVTPAAVTHWLNGDTKSIKGNCAAGIQAATGFSAAYIASGKLPKMADQQSQTDRPKLDEPATPVAMEIALLFDEIPVSDRVRRTQAYNAATKAILDILEGQQATSHAKNDPQN